VKFRFALALLLVVAGLLAVPSPASATPPASNPSLLMTVQGVPATCVPGGVIAGTATVTVQDDGTKSPLQVNFEIVALTPFGRSTVYYVRVQMRPGETRTIPFSIPVDPKSPSMTMTLNYTAYTRTYAIFMDDVVQIG
jgi:hypothetical protein